MRHAKTRHLLTAFCGATFGLALLPAQCSTSWGTGFGGGTNGPIYAMATMPGGDLVVAGAFTTAGGVPADFVARWNGTTWSPLGSIATGGFAWAKALAVLPSGDVVVGGFFTTTGAVQATNIALWNGSSWSALGAGVAGGLGVDALCVLPGGGLVVGGFFTTAGGVVVNQIARWNGATWSALGTGLSPGSVNQPAVHALVSLPDGNLVAGGEFVAIGGTSADNIARWDGAAWHALGSGLYQTLYGRVDALAVLPNGDLVAGGNFTTAGGVAANRIARWDGTAWSALGSGMNDIVFSLAVLPNGDLVAGGNFTTAGGVSADHIARWDGSSWSAFGAGLDSRVSTLSLLPVGDLVVGGGFSLAGGTPTNNLAHLTTSCPATVTLAGAGCTGSAGVNVLAPLDLPWTGSTFHARATGLASSAIAAVVVGLNVASTPMSALLPQGGAGCVLHTTTESVQLAVPTAGRVDTRLAIPNSAAFAGVMLLHQVLAGELDALGNVTSATSTNALRLTLGTL